MQIQRIQVMNSLVTRLWPGGAGRRFGARFPACGAVTARGTSVTGIALLCALLRISQVLISGAGEGAPIRVCLEGRPLEDACAVFEINPNLLWSVRTDWFDNRDC